MPDALANRLPSAERRFRRRARVAARYVLLVIVAAVVLFPVYAALMVAQKPLDELGDLHVLVPDRVDLGNVSNAITDAGMGRYLINSFIVASAITVGQITTSILGGYALAFVDFAGRRAMVALLALSLLVPIEVTIVVNFETVQRLGWIDTYWALIVPFLVSPIGTFLLRQAFLGIPRDLRDAATVDGYGHLAFLRTVAVPLVRPTVAAFALFSFLLAWNQYLWPLMVTNRDDRRTVQIGLEKLSGAVGPDINLIMTATLIAALPILVLLVLFERQIVAGLTAGSVKG
jgi:ABC-type glycerol-3-phosphate transport system permease component